MTTARLAALLPAPLLTGCSRAAPEPAPKLSTWAEQLAAIERAVGAGEGGFQLVAAEVIPLRDKPAAPAAEPVELRGIFSYVSPKSPDASSEGRPLYPLRMVKYNDHHLATTLRADEAIVTGEPPPPGAGGRARLMRLGPQDVLRLTRAEGEAHMGEPVYRGNITIKLARASDLPDDANAPAAWASSYYSEEKVLTLVVDAQTGTILRRSTAVGVRSQPEAARSPGS